MNLLIDRECPRYVVFLATLNFVLGLYGYEFIATMGNPFMAGGHSQIITIPYRAVCLGISLYLIFCCKPNYVKLKPVIVCLIIYWMILILRLVYDFYIQWDFDIRPEGRNKVLLFFLCINLPQSLSYALSWEKVDYGKAFKYLALMLVSIAVFNFIFNPALLFGTTMNTDEALVTSDGRLTGGVALNTISFAHCGVALSLVALYTYNYVKEVNKYLCLFLFGMGAFIMLKAGSRGPFVCFTVILLMYYSFKAKQIIYVFLIATLFCIVIYACKDLLLTLVKDVSPVLYNRTMLTLEKGNLSGRDHSFEYALEIWKQYPLLGRYFTYYLGSPAIPGYTHNVFFDSMIMGGMVGVAMMAYFYWTVVKSLYVAMKYSSTLLWIPLIILQKYLACQSSGAFWETPAISMGLACVVCLLPYFEDNSDYEENIENEESLSRVQ